ncbi:MAG: hypothetical protein K6C97_00500 [Treponema sp.]|nr:hypothetical protein [Treponema sp.]
MKNKFTIVYTIFASLGFLFALSFLGLNLYREYNYSSLNAEKKFDNIAGELTYAAKDPNLNTKLLLNKLNQTIGSLNDFSYLSISVNDVELIKYPSKANQMDTASKLTKSYDKYIQTEVGTFHIACNLYLLRPSSIFYYGKVAFIIVLLITLLTIIIIVYENISDEKEKVIVANDEAQLNEDSLHQDKETDNNEIIYSDNNKEVNSEISSSDVIENKEADSVTETESTLENQESQNAINETEETPNTSIKDADDTSDSIKTNTPVLEVKESSENIENQQVEEKVQLPSEEEKPLSSIPIDNNNPHGLFNPVTGLGWEEYLITRLDSEINRAIASEIDFSLFVIELPGLARDSEYIKNVCNYLAIQFQFKDLLFEYQEDCLVAMKINMNLDEALNLADKVYAGIKNIIEDNPCYIGISTRSIRMVSGQRILKEATEALAHTKDDKDSPIIAFRVDADKYRQFLEKNN